MGRRTASLLLIVLVLSAAAARAECPRVGSTALRALDPLVIEVDVERATPLGKDACRIEGQARVRFPARWDVQKTVWIFADGLLISVDWATGAVTFSDGIAIGELTIDKPARSMSVAQPLTLLTIVAVDGDALHTMQFTAEELFGTIRPRRISWLPTQSQ